MKPISLLAHFVNNIDSQNELLSAASALHKSNFVLVQRPVINW